MRIGLVAACVVTAGCAMRGPLMTGNSSGNSANSSGQSGNSSGQSGNSSGQSGGSSNSQSSGQSGQSSNGSAASSNGSAASSQGSAQSSNSSNQSSQSSANSNQSSNASSANSSQSSGSSQATTQSSANSWSQVAVASALLSAVGGGITTTVYSVRWRREAQMAKDELKKLQQGPQPNQPQPMPYKVEPIPVQPGPAPAPAPAPDPGFAPAPFPKKTELLREEEEPRFDAMIQARSWLLANELQLRQDLALGAGPTVVDLAGVAGIRPEHRAHFGRLLQKNRALFKVTPEVTPEEAARVFSQVGDLVMTDAVLRSDGLAALAALQLH